MELEESCARLRAEVAAMRPLLLEAAEMIHGLTSEWGAVALEARLRKAAEEETSE